MMTSWNCKFTILFEIHLDSIQVNFGLCTLNISHRCPTVFVLSPLMICGGHFSDCLISKRCNSEWASQSLHPLNLNSFNCGVISKIMTTKTDYFFTSQPKLDAKGWICQLLAILHIVCRCDYDWTSNRDKDCWTLMTKTWWTSQA